MRLNTIFHAKFIGQDSCGFEHGKEYDLIIKLRITNINGNIPVLFVMALGGMYAACPYSSIESFMDNWEDIKIVRK